MLYWFYAEPAKLKDDVYFSVTELVRGLLKANRQHQITAFLPSLDELVAAGHPVRVVHDVLERIDITALLQQYKPGATSSYHPRMQLKALVYAYINNIYSSRKIEEALQENIHFM